MWKKGEFNKEALFSDESGYYRKPAEPNRGDRVEIRFRTARNQVDLVTLIRGNQKIRMEKAYTKGMFDYYVCLLGPLDGPVHYFFEIMAGEQKLFYNKLGVTEELEDVYAFQIQPDFHTPDWAKGAWSGSPLPDGRRTRRRTASRRWRRRNNGSGIRWGGRLHQCPSMFPIRW